MSGEPTTPVTDEIAFLRLQQERDANLGDRVFSRSLDRLMDGGLMDPPSGACQPWDDEAMPTYGRRSKKNGKFSSGKRVGLSLSRHGTFRRFSQGCNCEKCYAASRPPTTPTGKPKGFSARRHAARTGEWTS
jgi:hypothetical protein